MICQNCNKNEANMHMKRIINGRAAEVHLCSDCARSLGYGEAFSDFGLDLGELFGELLGKGKGNANTGLRCHGCGKTFDEIVSDGKMGCAECYTAFYDRLLPSLRRIHGKATYVGSNPQNSGDIYETHVSKLKQKLSKAIEEQNFELAAQLRDEINAVMQKGGDEQ